MSTLIANSLTVLGATISTNEAGLFSLNDLHKAGGGLDRNRPTRWMKLKRTKSVVFELNQLYEIPTTEVVKNKGTFICRELVYSYAMHVSAKFEIDVIHAFDEEAQKKLRKADNHGRAEYHQGRELGIIIHRELTDVIKPFVGYAQAQGSRSASNYYQVFAKLLKKNIGFSDRDECTPERLHLLSSAEQIIEAVICEGMDEALPYKQIYRTAKLDVEAFVRSLRMPDD